MNRKKQVKIYNYTAYLLMTAVYDIWPNVKFGLIESTENGFYCDFDLNEQTISEKDFSKIETRISDLMYSNSLIKLENIPLDDAKEWLRRNNQTYLLEYISDCDLKNLLLYRNKNFQIVVQPEITSSNFLGLNLPLSFKIIKIGGAYWQNDSSQTQLQRLQLVVFNTQNKLDDFIQSQKDKTVADYRQIGKDQDLFMFSDLVGTGLPMYLENGATIIRQLENYIINEEIKRGYSHVRTPDIASLNLYETSGHYPYYKDSMYAPIDIDGKKFMLRPMSCPHHFQIYNHKPHSYKELPIRYAEIVKLYRYEQSGELSGLTRTRTFTLTDGHIFCRPDQVEQEIESALELIEDAASVFKLTKNKDYFYRLSLGDRNNKDKYYNDDQAWDQAEKSCRNVLQKRKIKFTEEKNEAAFYGPKIDVQVIYKNGKEDTAFTVQYDFVMPKRFKLTYIDENQVQQEVVVIHRSSIGAIERVFPYLIEFYQGRFPVWLSPCQLKILTVNNTSTLVNYAYFLQSQAFGSNIRAKLDVSDNSIGKKIRQSQLELIPYTVVIGDKEIESEEFKVNIRSDLKQASLSTDITYNWVEILQGLSIDIDSKV